jgi:hypothetical protein
MGQVKPPGLVAGEGEGCSDGGGDCAILVGGEVGAGLGEVLVWDL